MTRFAFASLLSFLAAGAQAEPMKCVDASGKVRYIDSSMVGTEKCQTVKEGTNVVAPQGAPAASRGDRRERGERSDTRAPRPQPQPQASQDPVPQADPRLLSEAEGRLAEARKTLAEQEAIRLGGERNYARVQERLQPYQETVERAQQEVEQLRRSSR